MRSRVSGPTVIAFMSSERLAFATAGSVGRRSKVGPSKRCFRQQTSTVRGSRSSVLIAGLASEGSFFADSDSG
jgi:hypothetical protein